MFIPRNIYTIFKKITELYPIVALAGPRQSGKTTFLKEYIKDLGGIYLMFDDPDVRELFDLDIKQFENKYLANAPICVLDEIQYAKKAGMHLKYLADSGRKLLISSSSELLMGKEIFSYLVGRAGIVRMSTFSIDEILHATGAAGGTRNMIAREVEKHILYGGYPKVFTTDDPEMKQILLQNLQEIMILKDIAAMFSIENLTAIEKFVQYLAINTGSQLVYDSIAQTIGLSFLTAKKYLDALEKSYLVFSVKPFYTNKNKELSKQPKVYYVDTGLRNRTIKSYNLDGKIFENYVASELLKEGYTPKYWRSKTKQEVDFVIEKGTALIPIEVKLNSAKHGRSLRSFIEIYKPARALQVTFNSERAEMQHNGCRMITLPVDQMLAELRDGN